MSDIFQNTRHIFLPPSRAGSARAFWANEYSLVTKLYAGNIATCPPSLRVNPFNKPQSSPGSFEKLILCYKTAPFLKIFAIAINESHKNAYFYTHFNLPARTG